MFLLTQHAEQAMITDTTHWDTLTKEQLIAQCIEFDTELDEVLIENATLTDELSTLQNLLIAHGIQSPL